MSLDNVWTPEMLRSRTKANEAGRQLSQNRKPLQQAKHERQRLAAARSLAGDHSVMDENLHSLDPAGWPFAARLHFAQIVHRNRTGSQLSRKQIRSRDGILNGEIDSYAASG